MWLCRGNRIGVMLWMYWIEASAGIYESTRLGEQGSPGYIWQFPIRISTTTKYTLIIWVRFSFPVKLYMHNAKSCTHTTPHVIDLSCFL